MTRQEKYPDTKYFHYFNANPHNRITGDCVTRALCTALKMDYNQCVMEQAENQCKTGYDNATPQGIETYLKSKGWVKMSQPRKADGTKYLGTEWCDCIQKGIEFDALCCQGRSIVANIGGHHTVAIVNGVVWDIWNSSASGCIGNYWIKM